MLSGSSLSLFDTHVPHSPNVLLMARGQRYRRLFDASPAPQLVTAVGARAVLDMNAAARALGPRFLGSFRNALAVTPLRAGAELGVRLDDGTSLTLRAYAVDGAAQLLWVARETPSAREAELEAAVRGRDRFISVLSHDLRGPISVVIGWAQLLRREKPSEASNERALAIIERSARAQLRLVEELLDVSRIGRGQLRLERVDLELGRIVANVVDGLVPTAAERGVELTMAREDGAMPVHADRRRIEQIVTNLVTNALKFTPRGGHVVVSLSSHDGRAVLRVRDDGRGISLGLLPFVFECFRQDHANPDAANRGLGLGLFIVRHLVREHGGEVTVESAGPDTGALFTVRLPLATSAPEAAESCAVLPPDEDVLAGVRVLVVEDEREASDLVSAILRGAGADVVAAEDAKTAASLFASRTPDVLVSDIGLPDADGCALLRRLRARAPSVPAIALTGYAAASDEARGRAAGFARHLAKPVNPSQLVQAVRDVVGERRSA